MRAEGNQKVQSCHLARNAYLYVRQSTLRQLVENTESTQRQYALKQRAVALGWPADQVVVIDNDLGLSGASAADREGFQKLVTEVSLGRAGIVMGLEVSRLARNCTDWHRLLEICAVADTLILDEDGIYDPAHFNDSLLLGLKGTMSQAELHLLRARLRGGILNKVRRGELRMPLPLGLTYDAAAKVIFHPDRQVQNAYHMLFQTFRRVGSALGTVKSFHKQGLKFPRVVQRGPNKGEIIWGELDESRVLSILHNPRYAGAFAFGRTRQKKIAGRQTRCRVARKEWTSLIPGAHVGYICWKEFEENEKRLSENALAHGDDRRRSPPREGPALLQGLVLCGICGERMTVRYDHSRGQMKPIYLCQRNGGEKGITLCQTIPGVTIDEAIGEILIEAVSPMALEVALAVQTEIEAHLEEVDRLQQKQVERARYEAELARRRYARVDPDNRLVADELEADWNQKLRAQREAEEDYQKKREADHHVLDNERRARILSLANNVPQLWRDPNTPTRERKRIVRLLVEDVTLRKGEDLSVQIRFRGGANRTLTLPRPRSAWELRQTSTEVIAEIDQLLDDHSDTEIASVLNAKGMRSGEGKLFHRAIVCRLRHEYGLKSRYERLREVGMLTSSEVAQELNVTPATVNIWRQKGLLRAACYDDRNCYLYEPPGSDRPVKWKQKSLRTTEVTGQKANEV
jgi:DNA invertase Pin-like site-specific DNA recombinase